MNKKYAIFNKLEGGSVLLIFLVLLFSACSKNILDKTPLNNFSDASVWQDDQLINAFINHTYQIVPHGFNDNSLSNFPLSAATDELFKLGGGANITVNGSMNPSNSAALNVWEGNGWAGVATGTSYWPVISNCNIFFSKIYDSPVEDTVKQQMIGQMKFFRAYAYFMLVAHYGGVPLIERPFGIDDKFDVARNTYRECMDFVVKELDSAINDLPVTWPDADKGRVTKGAAMTIKSRALLYMASPLNNPSNDIKKWHAASAAAKAVIDLHEYALFADYKGLFLLKNAYNSEVIWSRQFNYSTNPEPAYLELLLLPNGYNGHGALNPLQNIVDDYQMSNGEIPVLGYNSDGTPIINPRSGYDPQNPFVDRDPRFYDCILYDGAMFQGRAVETFLPGGKDSNQGTLSPWNASQTGYYIRKFIDESIVNPSPTNNGNSPWIFCRYAEILLNYAEAQYELGNESVCRDYINQVRNRPGVQMPPVTAGGDALLKALQEEYRIEFAFEGHRYFDIRRWKIAPKVMNVSGRRMAVTKNPTTGKKTYSVKAFNPMAFYDKNYLVPIPQSEIDKDAKLVQNPGY